MGILNNNKNSKYFLCCIQILIPKLLHLTESIILLLDYIDKLINIFKCLKNTVYVKLNLNNKEYCCLKQ